MTNDSRENEVYIGVYVLDAAFHFDNVYDYYLTEDSKATASRGMYVIVPFGGGNRRRLGVIVEVKDKTEAKTTKPADYLVECPPLSDEQITLALFIKENTFSTFGEAVRTVSPVGLRSELTYSYSVPDELLDPHKRKSELTEKNRVVINYVLAGKNTLEDLTEEFGDVTPQLLKALTARGQLIEHREPAKIVHEKTAKFIMLDSDNYDNFLDEFKGVITIPQEKLIEYLLQGGEFPVSEVLLTLDISMSAINTLSKKKVIKVFDKEIPREYQDGYSVPHNGGKSADESDILTLHQEKALEKLKELYQNHKPCAALLHGVTGSGKTVVLKHLMQECIDGGRQVIMLVPEISLTPQTVTYFKLFFGSRVKVLHSQLSPGERFDSWRAISRGDCDIVIGTRSAVFAPFTNIGLIIIDEEHEHTYKSEQKPYYHARDIARFRCKYHDAMMVLSSATPLIESYHKAANGAYTLVSLTERYGGAVLPSLEVVDMREAEPDEKLSFISGKLRDEITSNLARGEQTVIFKNRRGYFNFLSCRSCGETVECPNCSVALKLHTRDRVSRSGEFVRRNPDTLICHYCGHAEPIPEVCPKCKGNHLHPFGSGTQKCEDDLAELFPEARIARLDADATSKKLAYTRILNEMAGDETDILIGTQMVTKGHNFRNVTLVGVLFADQGMLLDDYRAGERTYAMIVQAAGRAGRFEKGGRAVIQTYRPDHDVIRDAVKQDFESFYNKEIKLRKSALFPPFADICVINVTSIFENEAVLTAKKADAHINSRMNGVFNDVEMIVYGPFPATIFKINCTYRYRLVIKCRFTKRVKELLSHVLAATQKETTSKVSVNIDVNPNII
ncbi:primosomal protein N' [Clostridia bacterium]|nr:primosomal protein N' [Clostridia bacterium]